MTDVTPTVILDGLRFPEGPRWHDGRLWFSDQHEGRVIALSPDGDATTIVEVPNWPSGLGWTLGGDLLVVSMRDQRLLRLDRDDGLVEVADLSAIATYHCNDMVVDAVGRAYVGNFGFDFEAGDAFSATALARVDPDGTVTTAATDLAFPNGTVITPDGGTLIIAESFAAQLSAFTVEADGSLTDRRVWAAVPDAAPDGCCLDADGAIWVADALGHQVLRVREGGAITDAITIDGANRVFAAMLGGPERRTLYLCTAPSTLPADTKTDRGGRIEAITVEVPGAGLP